MENKAKPKSCRICKDKFTPFKTTDVVCSKYDCRVSFALKHVNNQRKEKAKVNRIETKQKRESLKTLSQYESEAKKSFQKFIRLRDKDLPCISCGNPNAKDWCGSHYFPAGIYSGLIFDERNCHRSCNTYCNLYLSGNLLNYRIGLINRYGQDFITALENDANTKKDYKYTKDELIALKRKYDDLSKELQKNN
jgi:hypothetical protein